MLCYLESGIWNQKSGETSIPDKPIPDKPIYQSSNKYIWFPSQKRYIESVLYFFEQKKWIKNFWFLFSDCLAYSSLAVELRPHLHKL